MYVRLDPGNKTDPTGLSDLARTGLARNLSCDDAFRCRPPDPCGGKCSLEGPASERKKKVDLGGSRSRANAGAARQQAQNAQDPLVRMQAQTSASLAEIDAGLRTMVEGWLNAGIDTQANLAMAIAPEFGLSDGVAFGILREASLGRGAFTIVGKVTDAEARTLGEAWVGPGSKLIDGGKGLVSADGLRVFRFPTGKSYGGTWANFESRAAASGPYPNNGHLEVGP